MLMLFHCASQCFDPVNLILSIKGPTLLKVMLKYAKFYFHQKNSWMDGSLVHSKDDWMDL